MAESAAEGKADVKATTALTNRLSVLGRRGTLARSVKRSNEPLPINGGRCSFNSWTPFSCGTSLSLSELVVKRSSDFLPLNKLIPSAPARAMIGEDLSFAGGGVGALSDPLSSIEAFLLSVTLPSRPEKLPRRGGLGKTRSAAAAATPAVVGGMGISSLRIVQSPAKLELVAVDSDVLIEEGDAELLPPPNRSTSLRPRAEVGVDEGSLLMGAEAVIPASWPGSEVAEALRGPLLPNEKLPAFFVVEAESTWNDDEDEGGPDAAEAL